MRNLPFKLSMWGIAALVTGHVIPIIISIKDPSMSITIVPFMFSLIVAVGFVWFSGWLTKTRLVAGGILQLLGGLGFFGIIILGFMTSKGDFSGDALKTIFAYVGGIGICGFLLLVSAWFIFFRPSLIRESRPPEGNQHIYGFPAPNPSETRIEE